MSVAPRLGSGPRAEEQSVAPTAVRPVAALQLKFNIINLHKPSSLFSAGMQPLVYSMKEVRARVL